MMKKLICIALILCMAIALCACGINTNFTKTESVTENGVTTTTTTTTTNGQTTTETYTETQGEVSQSSAPLTAAEAAEDGEIHTIAIVLVNESGKTAISEFGCCPTGDGGRDNLLDESIAPNSAVDMTLRFNKDNLVWDFFIVPEGEDADRFIFSEIDISNADIDDGFTLYFIEHDDGSWSVEGK